MLIQKTYETSCGTINYWTNDMTDSSVSLVFLPGLTADHRLFDKQVAYFENKYRLLVWDAPGHGRSWPFDLSFTLRDKAQWLDAILRQEDITYPIIIGQSMGGYVGQMYSQLYPDRLRGFVAIDSAPLQRRYVTSVEIWLLKHMTFVYRLYPWRWLLKLGVNGVATSAYGRALMQEIMMTYDGNKERYVCLSGHGSLMLAEAMEADMPYIIKCPALLICGEKDRAGSAIRYNREWHNNTGIPIKWIVGAGHNSNTDAPDDVNSAIELFVINQ
jgi:pimeloyl-ACP methyl ester carboxylesterase